MATQQLIPETRVLAVASHVTHGYVGNKMASFVMQALGCDVCAINTVNFSNHTAYKQFAGRKTPASEIQELYNGLKSANLADFDMMLSGYIASQDAVQTVGSIGRDQRLITSLKPGSFFWVLDPVMGDNGQLYVAKDIVPAYRSLLPHADLILPNAFEAQELAETAISDMPSLTAAITKLHKQYQVPHIIVTSLRISPESGQRYSNDETIAVVGSSCTSDHEPRLFSITVPSLPVFFSGTGDMFAALMSVRLREQVVASAPELLQKRAWLSDDDVRPTDLPLARAAEKVLASMHSILTKTAQRRETLLAANGAGDGGSGEDQRILHLKQTRAAEIQVTRHVEDLVHPAEHDGVSFKAQPVQLKVPPVDVDPGDKTMLGS